MIKLLRIDERFIHGQVSFAWTNNIGANCIYIVNDEIASNKLLKSSLKLAAPPTIKFIVHSIKRAKKELNGSAIDKYNVFLIVNSTQDALSLIQSTDKIKQVNLGNMKKKENSKKLTSSVSVTEDDVNNIKEIIKEEVEVEIRAVPTDRKVYAINLIE